MGVSVGTPHSLIKPRIHASTQDGAEDGGSGASDSGSLAAIGDSRSVGTSISAAG